MFLFALHPQLSAIFLRSVGQTGIGWVIDESGHVLVPTGVAPKSEEYAIEVRYADGFRSAAKRITTFGHLTLLKPETVRGILPVPLNSQRTVQERMLEDRDPKDRMLLDVALATYVSLIGPEAVDFMEKEFVFADYVTELDGYAALNAVRFLN